MGHLLDTASQTGAAKPSNAIGNIIPIMQLLSGIGRKQQSSIAGQSMNMSNAMANPSNPLYQQLYGQFNQQNKANAAGAISAADAQNRLNSAMGRVPLFSPERNGQQSFRNAVMASQNAGQMANQQTQAALEGANRGLTGGGGALGAANDVSNRRDFEQGMGYGGLANYLRTYGY